MNSREKGKRGERMLAQVLREHGYEARRGLQYKGGAESPDVIGLAGIHIECKFVEHLNLSEAYAQAFRDAGNGEIPAVFHKKSREPWMVSLTLEDFLKIYGGSHGIYHD